MINLDLGIASAKVRIVLSKTGISVSLRKINTASDCVFFSLGLTFLVFQFVLINVTAADMFSLLARGCCMGSLMFPPSSLHSCSLDQKINILSKFYLSDLTDTQIKGIIQLCIYVSMSNNAHILNLNFTTYSIFILYIYSEIFHMTSHFCESL